MSKEIEALKRVMPRVCWCPRCNVPVIGERCSLCGGFVLVVRVTPPGDVRPAFERDVEHVRELLYELLGDRDSVDLLLPRDKFVLLNKIQYPDAADEVVVDGQILGHRFFDVERMEWRFKPLYNGVAGMLEYRIGHYAIVDRPALARRYEVRKKHVVEGELPEKRGEFIAVATANGRYHAVAEYLGASRLRILKAWRARKFVEIEGGARLEEVAEANEERLEELEREAVEFSRGVAEKFKLPAVVSFSGGKDSLATYLLVEKALGEVPVLFNDTGLELPETVEYVKKFAERRGIELLLADAEDKFFEGLEVMGPPARDYRWCCKVAKLSPIARVLKQRFPGGVLSFVGQRALESARRALSPRIWRNPWLPEVVAASPIQYWTSLDVWLYIAREGEEANPLYEAGFDRLGCWLCPACELGEFALVEEIHPELWSKWEEFLLEYAREHELDEKWATYGLWRWRRLPGDERRLAERLGVEISEDPRGAPVSLRVVEVEEAEGKIVARGVLEGARGIEAIASLAEIVGSVRILDGALEVSAGSAIVVVEEGGSVRAEGGERKGVADVLRKLWMVACRASYCIGCGSCANSCPTGALSLDRGAVELDSSRCSKCGRCNSACPMAAYSMHKMDLGALRVREKSSE